MNTGVKVISRVKGLLMNTYGEVISESGDNRVSQGTAGWLKMGWHVVDLWGQ